jgi:hypothetical protein
MRVGEGTPQVRLCKEPNISEILLDTTLAGFHFRHKNRDWLVIYGTASKPSTTELAELDHMLESTYTEQL